MLNHIPTLVRTEYKKYRKNSVALVLLGSFTVLSPLVILGAKRIFKYAPPPFPSPLSLMELPMIWDYNAAIHQHLIYVLLGFFVITTLCSEISNKTMRQNIINGYTKKEYFIAKASSYIVLGLFFSLLYFVSTVILGLLHTEGASPALLMDNNFLGIRYFLACCGFMSFAMMVSFLVRRSGLAIFLYFGAIVMIEQILRGIFVYITGSWATSRYFPLNSFEDLLPNPMYKMPDFIDLPNDVDIQVVLPYEHAMICAVIYTAAFSYLAWVLLKKKDL